VRVLGVPIDSPQTVVNRVLSDLGAVARLARMAPERMDRLLELGEEITALGHNVLQVAQRIDRRADSMLAIAERLDARAGEMIELANNITALGERVHTRGGEVVDSANRVAATGTELIAVLPALERAIEMATPLEGAIDRFGRLMDRLPGGAPARGRVDQLAPEERAETPESDDS
jgi:hypothetical protein